MKPYNKYKHSSTSKKKNVIGKPYGSDILPHTAHLEKALLAEVLFESVDALGAINREDELYWMR